MSISAMMKQKPGTCDGDRAFLQTCRWTLAWAELLTPELTQAKRVSRHLPANPYKYWWAVSGSNTRPTD
ncbi:phage-related hypothetical protein [Bordetella bronchiseptica RB50]|uniref:Uncharacterized protein n=1 Tax=Bordetella bronchiseptica (strain ATCC BAA-588 / NCTC 13252 / RB50) TaxID=257310 RepID=A0A0H3LQE0_BORBR|nr:phage-related hypothetical protein [Bordetella bronchiseptica RB50]